MEIIQIVPGLPPAISGVGDYAFLLAKQLLAAHGILTTFVVCDTGWSSAVSETTKAETLKWGGRQQVSGPEAPVCWDGFPVYQLKARNAAEMLRVLSGPGMPATVLLHYVGYGYEKRGCPVWLVNALRAWAKAEKLKPETLKLENKESAPTSDLRSPISERQLITMFHELYATGKPWQSSFWTSPIQQWTAKSLACMSKHCITNLRRNVPVLQRMSGNDDSAFTVLPVFSNVGEPEWLPDWNNRRACMIVFGSAVQRRKVYFEYSADLERSCQSLNLTEIVDIGKPFKLPPLSVKISQRGILPAQEISMHMLSARAAFFAYPVPYLGKSTIFAAYAAHGLLPITFTSNTELSQETVFIGEYFVSASFDNIFNEDKQKYVSSNIYNWYQGHSLIKQAKIYAKFFTNI